MLKCSHRSLASFPIKSENPMFSAFHFVPYVLHLLKHNLVPMAYINKLFTYHGLDTFQCIVC